MVLWRWPPKDSTIDPQRRLRAEATVVRIFQESMVQDSTTATQRWVFCWSRTEYRGWILEYNYLFDAFQVELAPLAAFPDTGVI